MKFIHVLGSPTPIDTNKKKGYDTPNINLTKRALLSLIYGLKQKNFGFDTVKKIALKIRNYVESEAISFDLYIDSGGYSIIGGDVPFDSTHKFIESYHQYLEHHHMDFNYIFSLDIPVWGKQNDKNTVKNLYAFNKISQSYSKKLLQRYPEMLLDKFLYVWQFKIIDQYEVWNSLYEELEINQWIKNRAIGGLVSIRDDAHHIDFAAFIPMAYRCFSDHMDSPYAADVFKLHFLGINLYQDRFAIALLEKMFQFYLYGEDHTDITYDSINYKKSSLLNARSLQIYDYCNGQLVLYKSVHHLPEEIVDKVYYTPELKAGFLHAKELLDQGEKLSDTSVFVPLNIYSNIKVDQYFINIIAKYKFVELLTFTDFKTEAMTQVQNALYDMEKNEPAIFPDTFFGETSNNLDLIYDLNQWCVNGRDKKELDRFIREVITERIRFPFRFE